MNLIGVNSPVRLLREKWSNPVDLAQELYAMFTAKGPAELHDTLTIKVPQGKTALRIESVDNSVSTTSFNHGAILKSSISTAPSVPGRRPPPPPTPQRPAVSPADTGRSFTPTPLAATPAASPAASQREAPLVEVAGSVAFTGKAPIQFSQPPVIVNPRTGRQDQLATRGDIAQQAAQPNLPFWGIVTEGSGNSYQVQFYQPNFVGNGQGIYTVMIPNIDPDETIPAGAKMFPIWLISGVYYYQPAVWL